MNHEILIGSGSEILIIIPPQKRLGSISSLMNSECFLCLTNKGHWMTAAFLEGNSFKTHPYIWHQVWIPPKMVGEPVTKMSIQNPIGSMYGILFTYIYHEHQTDVGRCTIQTWIRGFLYFGHPERRGSKSEKAQHEVTQTWPPQESYL